VSEVATQQTQGEVAVRTPQQELVSRVRTPEFREQIRLALPSNVTPDRFVRATATAMMQNPDLANAEIDSVFQSLLKCAQDGLLPDGREAALVIFNTKDGKKAQYLSMIGGLRKIAAEYGWAIRTQVVYENEVFEYEPGLEPKLTHRPVRPGHERGARIAAYAVGAHKDGRREVEVLTAADIEKVRGVSRAKDSGPWKDWPERMWEKTAGRRLFAKLPLGERETERVARVIDASYEPADAAAALYGEQARAAYVPIEGEVVRDTPGVTPADDAAGVDQQADGGAITDTPGDAAAAPGVDDDPEPQPAPAEGKQRPFQPPDQIVDQAGAYTVGTGGWKGRTIADIAGDEAGVKWLAWVVGHQQRVDADVYANVLTFVRARLPQLVDGVKT